MPERRNRPPTVKRAKRLRGEMTEAEKKLWYRIQLNQLGGFHFRRQVSIGDYAVDFACLTKSLSSKSMAGSTIGAKPKTRLAPDT